MNRLLQQIIDGTAPGGSSLWPMHSYPAPVGINGVRDKGHKHCEAFAIMMYADTTGERKSLYIWNSRDGVTPFVVFVDGVEYQHAQWQQDKYSPGYRPAVGDLIFRDITPDEAKHFASLRLQRYKDTQYYPKTDTEREKLLIAFEEEMTGGPMLARVTAISFASESLNN